MKLSHGNQRNTSAMGSLSVHRKKTAILVIAILSVLLVTAGVFYVNDYYHADESVQEYLEKTGGVSVTAIADGMYLDGPKDDTALIFYPGAKVEYTAYLPLLYQLAEKGIDCFLIQMPCNLAFLGQNKAQTIMETYKYDHWYVSGHSLGGAMAASYASKHLEELDGLILLAAYPVKSLISDSQDSFSVLSVYGSNDGVLNRKKFEAGNAQMPANYISVCIEGGNHAQFGNYGEQKGDHAADISRKEQQQQTAEAALQMIETHNHAYKEQTQEDKPMTYQQITPQEAKEKMDNEKGIILLDVRTREEYDTGHIKQAICLPNEEIISEPEQLPDKAQPILVYCRSGNRSRQAAQKLADMGYENVFEFGGLTDWPYPEMVE